jgi:hypothetical protein
VPGKLTAATLALFVLVGQGLPLRAGPVVTGGASPRDNAAATPAFITYTLFSDPGSVQPPLIYEPISGRFTVAGSVLAAGVINASDIVSFSFSTSPFFGHSFDNHTATIDLSGGPIPIDPTTGFFTGSFGGLTMSSSVRFDHLFLSTVAPMTEPGSQSGNGFDTFDVYVTQGHWGNSLVPGTIPEPSAFVLSAVAGLAALVRALHAKR